MSFDWTVALHDFVKRDNELEIAGSIERMAAIQDERYLHMQTKRLTRLAEQNEVRQLKRTKNELKLKLLDVKYANGQITAVCKMSRRLHYVQKNEERTEARIEYVQIRLERQLRGWAIVNIVPLSREAVTSPPLPVVNVDQDISEMRKASRPFLHPAIRQQSAELSERYVYDREAAGHYADLWWDIPNPEFIHFKVDCTNYVSQCLYAGGVPMDYTNRRDQGWWYRGQNDQWSFSWSVAHSLYWSLANPQSVFRAIEVDDPGQLDIGDCIFYDWDGSGRYGHSVIVTAKDAYGMPLVNAHTTNSKHRYWDYKDSYAWSDETRYAFFHMES